MKNTVEAFPESIEYARVQELISALGLPLDDLISFSIDRFAVTAEVWAVNESGKRYWTGNVDHKRAATHTISIPVAHPDHAK